MTRPTRPARPLEGVRVLEFGHVAAGPFAGMLLAARNLVPALGFVAGLRADQPEAEMERAVEEGKKAFAGGELAGQTVFHVHAHVLAGADLTEESLA